MVKPKPFNITLPRPLQVGDKISIDAAMKQDADIFAISLCEDLDGYTTNYHFKMNYKQEKGIFNTKFCGRWLTETWRNECRRFPEQGSRFRIELEIEEGKISTFISSTHFADFDLLTGLEEIKYFQIWEGLDELYTFAITFYDADKQ